MGSSKQSTSSSQSGTSTTTPQETAYDKAVNPLDVELRKAAQPGLLGIQSQGFDIISRLLGGMPLPKNLAPLSEGLSPEVQSSLVQESLREIAPGFQKSGLLDSGVRASIAARTAGDIFRSSAEFNIGNLQNLLNLGVGGQAQVQQPILGFSQSLNSRLAGLRPVTSTFQGSSQSISRGPNPFLNSFQQSLGQGLGRATAGGLYSFGTGLIP